VIKNKKETRKQKIKQQKEIKKTVFGYKLPTAAFQCEAYLQTTVLCLFYMKISVANLLPR
jgi:hypothetical protein